MSIWLGLKTGCDSVQRRRRSVRWFPEVHKPQVVRSLTRRWRKASPDAYSTNRINNVSCFTLIACDVLCTTCRVLFDDGDRLHGSTLLYTILDVTVLLLRLDVLCLVDSHR
jgi:hypothetical protein